VLFVSDDTLQYANIFPPANTIWGDPDYIAEEWFTGYRAILKSEQDLNTLFVSKKCCNGFSLGKVLTNNLQAFKTIPIFDLYGDCLIDCIIYNPNKTKEEISNIFEVGAIGAEKYGPFYIILLDVLRVKGVDIRNKPWKERRIYLQDIYSVFKAKNLFIPESVIENKKDFYASITSLGAKGVVLKNVNAPYEGGINKNFLRIRSNIQSGFKNKSFLTGTIPPKKDILEFDMDVFMAIQALDSPENIKKLKGE